MPLPDALTQTALALADKAAAQLEELPHWMEFLMPKMARRKQIAEKILAKALETPEALDEHDVKYLTNLLPKREAEWLKEEYVKHRTNELLPILAEAPEFQNTQEGKRDSDPSFEENLFAALQSVSVHDRPLLELYAQIRAGEITDPGSFSKRTCNVVKDLTAEAIACLEATAPLRLCGYFPLQIRCLLHQSLSPQFPSIAKEHWPDLLLLQEHGIVSLTHTTWTPKLTSIHISGAHFISIDGNPEHLEIDGFPFTTTGMELLRLHNCPPAEELKSWLIEAIPNHFFARIISPI